MSQEARKCLNEIRDKKKMHKNTCLKGPKRPGLGAFNGNGWGGGGGGARGICDVVLK